MQDNIKDGIDGALLNVYKAVSHVAKDGQVKGGKIRYAYASDSAFINATRPAMIENGLIIRPTAINDLRQSGNVITGIWTFTVTHSPSGETRDVIAIGSGQDIGDKGGNKAATGALKYALRQLLLISTGDDPDKDASVSRDVLSVDGMACYLVKQYERCQEEGHIGKIDNAPKTQKYKALIIKSGNDNAKAMVTNARNEAVERCQNNV